MKVNNEVLTVREAANFLKISINQLNLLRKKELIKTTKIKGMPKRIFYKVEDLQKVYE